MPRRVASDDAGIREVAACIREGGVAAFPTETVYGLGASTFAPEALRQVYALKGRPSDNPLIAHVVDAVDAKMLVAEWDRRCNRLAAAFWPGPLTLILPRGGMVPDEAVAGLPSIAVRSPMHPVAPIAALRRRRAGERAEREPLGTCLADHGGARARGLRRRRRPARARGRPSRIRHREHGARPHRVSCR